MPFFLPNEAISKLGSIRTAYQTKKRIDLDAPTSIFDTSTLFGGVDIKKRNAQIGFLEKWLCVLKPNLFKEEDITKEAEWGAHVTSSRVMIAVALSVQSQIKKSNRSSELSLLINQALGIATNNVLDVQDKEVCLFAAKRLVESKDAFKLANTTLKSEGQTLFSDREWDKFTTYLREHTSDKPAQDPYADYPITNISQKLFGEVFAIGGVAAAIVTTEALRKSSNTSSTKIKFGVLVGSALIVFNIFGPSAVQYAPVITEGLITAVGYISFASIFGKGMRTVGQGFGYAVGRPLDFSCYAVYATCKAVGAYYYPPEKNNITGIRIVDGLSVREGMVIIPEDKLPTKYPTVHIDLHGDQASFNGKQIHVTDAGTDLPQEMVAFLTGQELEVREEQHFVLNKSEFGMRALK